VLGLHRDELQVMARPAVNNLVERLAIAIAALLEEAV
jgi:hypothetical protein